MIEKLTYEEFDRLALNYLNEEVSDNELKQLEHLVENSHELKSRFVEIKKALFLQGMGSRQSNVDKVKAWSDLNKQTLSQPNTRVTKLSRKRRLWLMAAAVSAFVAVTAVFYWQIEIKSTSFAAKEGKELIELNDGTEVVLNNNGKLHWDENDSRRSVILEGDAFFDVARDESRPFLIHIDDVDIEVLGTSFYVDGRNDENSISVSVESGQVKVNEEFNAVVLEAGEVAEYNKNRRTLSKRNIEDINFNSIKTDRIVFDNTPISSVAETVSRHFGINIIVEEETKGNCPLTATFENKTLQQVEKVISSSLNLDIEHYKNQTVWSGSCTLD